jgi:hypothetical protein
MLGEGGKGEARGRGKGRQTWMMGSCPLIPAEMLSFLMSTTRSRPLKLPGTVKVMSRSPMV